MNGEGSALEARCRALAEALGLGEVRSVRPLTGGVASDIAVVELPSGPLCMKFARERLAVAADWRAPRHRSAAEYAWLEAASSVVPAAVPRLHGRSRTLHGFAMEYVDGPDGALWKTELLAGRVHVGTAAMLGRVLGAIHAASADARFDAAPFRNRDDFHALRIEPYLLFTAERHADVAPTLRALAARLHAADAVLVHGDVSPKNVLLRGGAPVLLDAECATMGDAAFDVAFCLNHLALKAVHRPDARAALLASMHALWDAYAPFVRHEPLAALDGRVAALLPALLLARIDGKSPVEYLSEPARRRVRAIAVSLLGTPPADLGELTARLSAHLDGERR